MLADTSQISTAGKIERRTRSKGERTAGYLFRG